MSEEFQGPVQPGISEPTFRATGFSVPLSSGGGGGGGGGGGSAPAVTLPSTIGMLQLTTLNGVNGFYTAAGFESFSQPGKIVDPTVPPSVIRNTPNGVLAEQIAASQLNGRPLAVTVDSIYRADETVAKAADANLLLRVSSILPAGDPRKDFLAAVIRGDANLPSSPSSVQAAQLSGPPQFDPRARVLVQPSDLRPSPGLLAALAARSPTPSPSLEAKEKSKLLVAGNKGVDKPLVGPLTGRHVGAGVGVGAGVALLALGGPVGLVVGLVVLVLAALFGTGTVG